MPLAMNTVCTDVYCVPIVYVLAGLNCLCTFYWLLLCMYWLSLCMYFAGVILFPGSTLPLIIGGPTNGMNVGVSARVCSL
jgi:hypothetical protein